MLMVVSPAKTLDFTHQTHTKTATKPQLISHSKKLIGYLQDLSPKQLGKLMNISEKLSNQVHEYVESWKSKYDTKAAKQAILAFRGDVYQGLDADSLKAKDFEFAQRHLRILSGLYGVLRPLDLMQAYRLEMGTKLKNDAGKDLYDFWGDRIAKCLESDLTAQGDNTLVNLASNEYFKAANAKSIDCRVITPVFKDRKGDDYKVISFYAKKARGLMARHIITERVTADSGILKFRAEGYKYNRGLSTEDQPVFTRDKPPVA